MAVLYIFLRDIFGPTTFLVTISSIAQLAKVYMSHCDMFDQVLITKYLVNASLS